MEKRIILLVLVAAIAAQAETFYIGDCQELDTADSIYILQNDVQSDGDCFPITRENVTLDLQGHTVIYGNSPVIGHYNAVTCYMYADKDIEVFNGTLVQGNGVFEQYYSSAVGCGANDSRLHDLKIHIHTNNSECISIGSPYNMSIYDNLCYISDWSHNKGYGMTLGGDGTQEIHIYNNTIAGGHRGIQLENGGDDIYLYNNLIQNRRSLGRKSPQGIYFGGGGTNHHVYNNQLVTDYGRGMKLSGETRFVYDNIIDVQYSRRATEGIGSQPYVENRCYGVWSRQGGATTVYNNRIFVDNLVMNDTGSEDIGIAIMGEPNWTVYNNTIFVTHNDSGRSSTGIEMGSAYGVNCDDVSITGNNITAASLACDLEDGDNLELTGNRLIRPVDYQAGWTATSFSNINGTTEPNDIIYDSNSSPAITNPTWVEVETHDLNGTSINEIRWDLAGDEVFGYRIYRDGIKLENDDCLSTRAGTFFVDTDGGEHCYGVASVDFYGNELVPIYQEGCQDCTDNDGDGYGIGSGCAGPDCDDSDSDVHEDISCIYDGSSCGEYELCVQSCPEPPAESCNGLDDDCDTLVDETFTMSDCSHVCEENGGAWGTSFSGNNCCGDAAGEAGPYEVNETYCSDGNDNDCDGLTDADDPDCTGIAYNTGDECDSWQSEHPDWLFCDAFENSTTDDYDGGWSQYMHYMQRGLNSTDYILTGNRSIMAQVTPDVNTGAGIYKEFEWQNDSVYARWYARFEEDYNDQGRMHFVSLRALDPETPCGCIGCCANQRPEGNDRFGTALEFSFNGSDLESHTYTYYHNQRNPSASYECCPKPLSTWAQSVSPDTPVFIERGRWYEMEIMMKPNTPGLDDGYQAYWIDGELIINSTVANEECGPYVESYDTVCEDDDPSLDVYDVYDNPPPYDAVYPGEGYIWRDTGSLQINYLWIQLYNHLGSTNPDENKVWFDNVVVSKDYIGPMECSEGTPIRAACYCGNEATATDSSSVYTTGFCCSGVWKSDPCGVHPADNNPQDGVISKAEIQAYVRQWLGGQATIASLMEGMRIWKG